LLTQQARALAEESLALGRVLGAAEAVVQTPGRSLSMTAANPAHCQRSVDGARAAPGEAAFAAAWEAGRAMPSEQVISYALGEVDAA
jgi:hypothetical protein